MPEADHVVGINNPNLAGPPKDPPSSDVPIPPVDQFNRGVVVRGDPDATSKRYFIETKSPTLADIVERIDDDNG